ncbi:hypothetical protein ACFX2G_034936 [Malus domestica]
MFYGLGDHRQRPRLLRPHHPHRLKGWKGRFHPQEQRLKELPYSISIIQISTLFPNQAAKSPTPAPAELNITGIMFGHSCKVFTDTLIANSNAFKTYDDNVDGGLSDGRRIQSLLTEVQELDCGEEGNNA